jgi:hypothetical protein
MPREFLSKLNLRELKKMISLHNKQDNLTPYYKMNKTEIIDAMMGFFTPAQLKTLALKAGYGDRYAEVYPSASKKGRGRPKGVKNVVTKETTKKIREEMKKAKKN